MIFEDGGNATITSTSKSTKGLIKIGTSAYDEANNRLGLLTQAPSSDLSLGGEADFNIVQEREATAATAGRNTKLQAGGAKSGSTDKAGGTLTLAGGIATGSGSSKVLVAAAGGGSTGTDDSVPVTALEVRGDGTVLAGRQAALAQGATAGFLCIPIINTGDPSGTPTDIPAGMCALGFCAVTGKFAIWDGSAWALFSKDA